MEASHNCSNSRLSENDLGCRCGRSQYSVSGNTCCTAREMEECPPHPTFRQQNARKGWGTRLAGFHECAEDVNIFHHRRHRGHGGFCVVILRPAFFAGRRIYGLVDSIGAAGRVAGWLGGPGLLVLTLVDTVTEEGAPSLRVFCERVGTMYVTFKPKPQERVGPRLPPLQSTQGWGTLARGAIQREQRAGHPPPIFVLCAKGGRRSGSYRVCQITLSRDLRH